MRRFPPPRTLFATFAELFALSGLLIAQPVFDFLGKNARVLIIFRLKLTDVLPFVLIVLLVPPAVVLVFELVIGAVLPRARRWMHIAILAVLIGVVAGNYVKVSTHLGAAPRIVASVIVGAAVGFYIIRSAVPQQWLRFLAIAPLIFALLFVFASPASVLFEGAKAADVTIAHPARVVMIVFDEFPEESLLDGTGHIDAELFPNFAKLAHDSTWYRNQTTVAEYTGRAVPAILTGKFPPTNTALPISSKYPQSLFTLLGKTYTMHAHEFYEQLCPTALCTEPQYKSPLDNLAASSSRVMHDLMDLDRSSWDDNVGFRFGIDVRPGNQPPLAVSQKFLASLRPSTKPTLDYLHVLLPHQPWHFLGSLQNRGRLSPPMAYLTTIKNDQRKVGLAREMHLLNVQGTDWYLGQVMDKLKRIGAYDNSLIVVTADHGVAFPFRRDTAPDDFDHIMWTPLFIKAPHQGVGQLAPGRIDSKPMLSVDVLPTMADILGVKIPWKIDGRSALGARRTPGPLTIVRSDISVTGRKETFDGVTGFARVLRARAAPARSDPALRLFGIGRYGRLIGKPVAGLRRAPLSRLQGTLTTPGNWNDVDLTSDSPLFTGANGTVTGVKQGTVAITVNGRVAGLAVIPNGRYYAILAPTLFRAGKNDVAALLVTGTPAKPLLIPISTTPAGESP